MTLRVLEKTGKAILLAVAGGCLSGIPQAQCADGPDAIFEKPEPVAMADLAHRTTEGVSAVEVKDYAPGHYTGPMKPSPPHADLNAGKAVVVFWKDRSQRLVFSHEASYCPWLELTNGEGMCNQFFEGNLGDAELFNNGGRKERNSFVDILQRGPRRVWVRWTYFCVNLQDDTKPRLRGTEDYFAYPNGLVLRRMTYESLMPGEVAGYSTQPVELFGVLPAGSVFKDLFSRDAEHGDWNVLSALDLYSDRRYDIYWDEKGGVRRRGNDATLVAIWQSPGCALVIPFRQKLLFAVLGQASGFPPKNNRLVDHCTPGAQGGSGWGTGIWDHWPIGWTNSQTSFWKAGSPFAYSFGSIGQFLVPDGKPLISFWRDYSEYCKDMDFNRWTERHVFYVLLGAAGDWDAIRRIGRSWLDQGGDCARPESIVRVQGKFVD
jgi:hypothetical protein